MLLSPENPWTSGPGPLFLDVIGVILFDHHVVLYGVIGDKAQGMGGMFLTHRLTCSRLQKLNYAGQSCAGGHWTIGLRVARRCPPAL